MAKKRVIKKSIVINVASAEPDFLIFKRRNDKQVCHVVELKDGDTFDTKKAFAERATMQEFINATARCLQYQTLPHFVCFNQNKKDAIYNGFKCKIPMDECMTGQEFCDLLEIDYQQVIQERTQHCKENFNFFIDALLTIDKVKHTIQKRLNS